MFSAAKISSCPLNDFFYVPFWSSKFYSLGIKSYLYQGIKLFWPSNQLIRTSGLRLLMTANAKSATLVEFLTAFW